MKTLLIKELKNFFINWTGYLFIAIFLLAIGLFLWFFPGEKNIFDSQIASLEPMFVLSPWLFMFLIPAITMKSFAEEKKTGTIELLLTRPLSASQIVIAKFLSAFIVLLIALLLTFVYFFSIQFFLSPKSIDIGATIGSYFGMMLIIAAFCSIGLFASNLTNNQIVAFLVSLTLIFIFYIGFSYISMIFGTGFFSTFFDFLALSSHYEAFSYGIIDLTDVFYFLSVTLIFIFLNINLLSKKK